MHIWVFGGTAAGKKYFIREALKRDEFRGYVPAWIEDGDPAEAELDGENLLIRWQWRREFTLHEMAATTTQRIVLVQTAAECQYYQAIAREGEEKWDMDALRLEALAVEWLALGLSHFCNLPLFRVNPHADVAYEEIVT